MVQQKVLIILMMLTATLIGCGAATATETTQTFSGEVKGLAMTFEYPASWQLEETDDRLVVADREALLSPETAVIEGGQVQIAVLPASMVWVDDLTQLMELELNTLYATDGSLAREAVAPLTVNEQEAVTAVLDSLDGQTTVSYTIIDGETGLVFVVGRMGSEEETELMPVIQQILNSVQVSPVTQ